MRDLLNRCTVLFVIAHDLVTMATTSEALQEKYFFELPHAFSTPFYHTCLPLDEGNTGGTRHYMYCAKLTVRSAFNMMQYSVERLKKLGLVGGAALRFEIFKMEKAFLLYRNICVSLYTQYVKLPME